MISWYRRISIMVIIFLLLVITVVNADESSIILDGDHTTDISSGALVFLSLAMMVFAAVVIIKLLSDRGE